MGFPRFRFTIRMMMIAVAFVGVLLGSRQFCRRRNAFQQIAMSHREAADRMRRCINQGFEYSFGGCSVYEVPLSEKRRALMARDEKRQLNLAVKYEHAARNPWLPVEPDAPEP